MASDKRSRNRGELSEIYVLLKLLSSDNSTILSGVPGSMGALIHRATVRRNGEDHQFLILGPEVAVLQPGRDSLPMEAAPRISKARLGLLAEELLLVIKNMSRVKDSYNLQIVEEILQLLRLPSVSGGASDKGDIGIDYFDETIGRNIERWFSIKSRIGAPPSFINAGANKVTYKVVGHEIHGLIDEFNKLDVRVAVNRVLDSGGRFVYFEMQKQFQLNLLIVDSKLDQIVAECLISSYRSGSRLVSDVVEKVARENRLEFPREISGIAYRVKFLNFLQDSALGMVPSKPWSGTQSVTGGFIVVTKAGEIVVFHPDSPGALRNYLWESTKFDTPGRAKYGNGIFRIQDDEVYFDLKMHIRYV